MPIRAMSRNWRQRQSHHDIIAHNSNTEIAMRLTICAGVTVSALFLATAPVAAQNAPDHPSVSVGGQSYTDPQGPSATEGIVDFFLKPSTATH